MTWMILYVREIHVGKVSSGFEYFKKIFIIIPVSKKVMTVSERASNILPDT